MKVSPKTFFLTSAYFNDISWVETYTDNYLIIDKSHNLPTDNPKIIRRENTGYNIADIFWFCSENYDNLPELIAFLEGDPFPHCRKETFDKLIYREEFTPIEDYSHIKSSFINKMGPNNEFFELNNSWYFQEHIKTHGPEVCRYFYNYNTMLDMLFKNPTYPQYCRFAPGAMYIVPRENILYYSKDFYKKILSFVDYHRIPAEAFAVERALWYIFTNTWEEK